MAETAPNLFPGPAATPGAPPTLPGDDEVLEDTNHFLGLLYTTLEREAKRLREQPPQTLEQSFAHYIGCDPLDLRRYETTVPDGNSLIHAIQAVLTSVPDGWTVHPRNFNRFNERYVEAVTYAEVEVGHRERAFCFAGGYLYTETPDGRWVASVGPANYDHSRTLAIYMPDGSEDAVRRVIDRFHGFRQLQSRFKGRRISVGDDEIRFLDIELIDWSDLLLEQHIIEELQRNVLLPISEPSRWEAAGLPLRRSILLSGPPGTGKTLIGKLIASKVASTFIWVTAEGMGSSRNVRRIYEMARENRPTVLFFEDLDVVASRQGGGVFGEILAQSDGLEPNDLVITIATTNHPESLDEAFKDRPGRFDRHMTIDLPNDELRVALFRHFTTSFHLACSPDVLRALADYSRGLSGAHIRELVMMAAIEALGAGWNPEAQPVQERELEHFIEAGAKLKQVRPEIGFLTDRMRS